MKRTIGGNRTKETMETVRLTRFTLANQTHVTPGLYIRAGSRRSSPASLPGFAGYFHCFTSQDYVKEMMFIRSHNRLLFTTLRLHNNLKKTLYTRCKRCRRCKLCTVWIENVTQPTRISVSRVIFVATSLHRREIATMLSSV